VQTLTASQTGCLLLADITGYTRYLEATELEHAQDVLADLLETLVDTLQPVFTLSKLEGDACFAYAEAGRVNPTLILDTVEVGYFAFRRRLRDIVHVTTCDCNACVLIPSLDLKYFVHHGTFVARHIAGTEELTGSDVVLVHRLMKGEGGSAVDNAAYAVYTLTTLHEFGMDADILEFVPFTENLADVGEVEVAVQDLTKRWEFENERNRVYVTEQEADWSMTIPLPVPVEVAWDYMTDPLKRQMWHQQMTSITPQTPGRISVGSVNHCMHGPDLIIEHVADWRPFSYYTTDYPMPHLGDGQFWRHTNEFKQSDSGPIMIIRTKAVGAGVAQWFEDTRDDWVAMMEANEASLQSVWRQHVPSV
jgi:hypothetical protein